MKRFLCKNYCWNLAVRWPKLHVWMFWIYRRLKSCLVHDFSWSKLTQKSHTFPPFMSFSSGTVFVVRNFPCPWICAHEALFAAIVLPILYCSFFFLCSVLPRLFHNSQLFLLSLLGSVKCYLRFFTTFPILILFVSCFTKDVFFTNSSFFFLQFSPFATPRRLLPNFCNAQKLFNVSMDSRNIFFLLPRLSASYAGWDPSIF